MCSQHLGFLSEHKHFFLKSFDEQFLPEYVEDLGLIQSAIYINLEIDLLLKSIYYN